MNNKFQMIVLIISLSALLATCKGGSGGSDSTTPTVTDTLPSVVTSINAIPGDGQATISWNPATGATSYNIYWSAAAGVTKATGTKISGIMMAPFYTQTGLMNGTSYYYVITAQNDNGETSESIEVRVIPSNLISVNIMAPSMGALAGKTLQILVTHNSTYQIQGVTAAVVDRQTNLVFSSSASFPGNCNKYGCGPGWVGSISLDGLIRGEKLLIVTATDVFNNTTVASKSFKYDQAPTLDISEPINGTVARPQMQFTASCADDDAEGCSLEVHNNKNDALIVAGQTSINDIVSLSAYDGESVLLRFVATDSAGQVSIDYRTVFVESSTKLVEVAGVGGNIWDVQPDRILFLDTAAGGNILKIRDRSAVVDTVVMNEIGKTPWYGFLTPKGAIFVEYSGNHVYDWRDSMLIDLGEGSSLAVKGDYAIRNAVSLLMLRDLFSGISTTIATDAGWSLNDVASNGSVVYWNELSHQIYRYSGGVTTQLTNDTVWNSNPLTDGVDVIYRKDTSVVSDPANPPESKITMYTASGEISLSAPYAYLSNPGLYGDYYFYYQVNNGWAAFSSAGADGVLQVWLRTPAGVLAQLSFFGTSSVIEALGPNGDVVWISGNRLYLSTFGATPVDIGSFLGKAFYQGGQWYATIGRSLFRIAP